MLSFFHPTPLTLTTPPELRPYGWTTTDLWCAPLITGLYALLTHTQPFWADFHVLIVGLFWGLFDERGSKFTIEAVDPEIARAICTLVLIGMFATRAVKNFARPLVPSVVAIMPGTPVKPFSSKLHSKSKWCSTGLLRSSRYIVYCRYIWEDEDPIIHIEYSLDSYNDYRVYPSPR